MAEESRRQFLQTAGLVGAGALLGLSRQDAQAQGARAAGEIPRRPFGRAKIEVSALGLGGHAIGQAKTESEGIRLVHEAIDSGVTFMDNAWEYHEGKSEEWMGKALAGGRRDKVFLMTKVCTHGRDKNEAMRQLEESLKRLQTDHLDLWQIHEVVYDNDPERHFARGGVIEALDQAKREGKTRFVGFTGHKHPDIHLKMLRYKYPFDACQLPLNAFDATYRSFETEVLPELKRQGIAPIAMKSLNGTGEAVRRGVLTASEALRYVLSLPIATLVSGINSLEILRENVQIARGFTPMAQAEMDALRRRVAPLAGDGRFERYKSTMQFDGEIGRRQHGFPPQRQLPG